VISKILEKIRKYPIPEEEVKEIEKELKMFEITIKLAYAKFISFKEWWEIIRNLTLEEKIELSHKIIEEAIRLVKNRCKEKSYPKNIGLRQFRD